MTNTYFLFVSGVLGEGLLEGLEVEFTNSCALTGVRRPDERLRMAAPAVAAPAPIRNFLLSEFKARHPSL